MREIKFRAWDKEKKIWVSNGEIEFSISEGTMVVCPNTVEHIGDSVHDMYAAERFEVVQYTGLKDKNGVKIYEGDIIRADEDIINFHTQLMPENSYEVRFWDGCWCLFSTDGMNIDLLNVGEAHSEVIGNIYENPELLREAR